MSVEEISEPWKEAMGFGTKPLRHEDEIDPQGYIQGKIKELLAPTQVAILMSVQEDKTLKFQILCSGDACKDPELELLTRATVLMASGMMIQAKGNMKYLQTLGAKVLQQQKDLQEAEENDGQDSTT